MPRLCASGRDVPSIKICYTICSHSYSVTDTDSVENQAYEAFFFASILDMFGHFELKIWINYRWSLPGIVTRTRCELQGLPINTHEIGCT